MCSDTAELVIIGAGIAGAATAYYAARQGINALVLDKGAVGAEQSSKAWGFVRQQGRDPAELPLMMAANALWRNLETDLDADIEWRMSGNLGVAGNQQQLAEYRAWQAIGKAHGLESQLLSAQDVVDLMPGIRREWTGGLLTPSDGHASPPRTTDAFAASARRLGATIKTDCAAIAIETSNGRVRGVRTEHGSVATERVVCAAGAWSSRLLRPLGFHFPQLRLRASVGVTAPAKSLVPIAAWTPRIAFRQRPDGVLVVARFDVVDHDVTLGSLLQSKHFVPGFRTRRERVHFRFGMPLVRDLLDRFLPDGFGADPARRWAVGMPADNRRSPAQALGEFKRLYAAASDLQLADLWSCYVDITPDLLPVLGSVDGCEGLTVATGLSGHGFGLGPIVGKVSADCALGVDCGFDLSAFSIRRWQSG